MLYAHGYVPAAPGARAPGRSGRRPVRLAATVTGLGYAFATTSYRRNGLVAPEAVEDLVELEATVRRLYRPDPGRTVIVGFSEGGLVGRAGGGATPGRLRRRAGGVRSDRRVSGPSSNYIGDFRVVFDYLFPGVIPGTAVDVPST